MGVPEVSTGSTTVGLFVVSLLRNASRHYYP